MSNKALRILIADEQHFQRMRIERLFNRLDYYRVVPVQNLAELLTLVDYGGVSFDLVIINAALAGEALNLVGFLADNPQVHHALVYNGEAATLSPIPVSGRRKIQIIEAALPDLPCIQRAMTIVDPRLPFVGTVNSVS
ncbi:response regulator [Pseudomonas sp. 14P_8.1_Bac3]|uniref:response regulator n=1 Tax=Pseudomonas sp. 14P_8.1_Bac3 TaxID=2971621 RepID=UPI0021CACB25|nr:response regulator [Pseudomonas sp. 14P_8.1_Bac3]MCU1761809.1 response regulator [Pseudomonas sp. 14P_8.1_Bac3]